MQVHDGGEDTKCISTCVEQMHYMLVTKMTPIAISTIFDQSHSMPAKSQNAPQHVVPVSTQNVTHVVCGPGLPYQQAYKMHLNV
jgi:hypothetical protein